MSAWVSIEFAPKDGTPVDFWMVRTDGTGYRLTNVVYHVSKAWKREGWFVESAIGDGCFWLNDSFGTPTHYSLPLPGPNT